MRLLTLHRRRRSSVRLSRAAMALLGMSVTLTGGPTRPPRRATTYSPIVELRQYTTHPEKRDVLMDMFDRSFIEPQEAAGITVIGQFRNLDDPNKFVWLRGFPDMNVRERALTEFYGGPVWKAHRDAANATILDNDNVLLLRPVRANAGFAIDPSARRSANESGSGGPTAGPGNARDGTGLVVATIYHIDPTPEKETEFVAFFEDRVVPLIRRAGGSVVAELVPERSANTFPRLPVREGEHVFVWFSRFANAEGYERFRTALEVLPGWRDSVAVELSSKVREPQTLRLVPSGRSVLGGR
jgi:hypothetical protein